MVKLYGAPTVSTCTRLVALILKEKNIPYELIQVNMAKSEHKAASFIAIQPFGEVPYIDDDGFILYESRAIARYLIKKYPNQGTPLINEERIGELLKTLQEKLDVYEVILSKQKYLAGDFLTLADLTHLPYGTVFYTSGFAEVFDSRPNLARWWKDVSNRPAWLAVKDGA
ncbi:thioredoxin-like protein [Suillus hirtellus]|nr:thioredoxin-like protein [Suillus hirtellus]